MSSWASIISSSHDGHSNNNNQQQKQFNGGNNNSNHPFKSVSVTKNRNNSSPSPEKNVSNTTSGQKQQVLTSTTSTAPSSTTNNNNSSMITSTKPNTITTNNSSNSHNNNNNNNTNLGGFDFNIWKTQQLSLKKQLIAHDHQLSFDPKNLDGTLKFIGGVDISFDSKKDSNKAVASLIILSFPDLKIVHEEHAQVEMTLPYIAGYLGFREIPHLQQLVQNVKNKLPPHLLPQLILVDGNGRLHQRGFGSACHLGVLEDIPTIGVAKKILMVKGLTDEYIDGLEQKLTRKGDCIEIDLISERRIGAILKTDHSTNVYISPGHRLCLDTSLEIVKRCCLKDIPEPIYQADLISRKLVKKYFNNQSNHTARSTDQSSYYNKKFKR